MVQKYTYLEPYLEDTRKLINLREFARIYSIPHQTIKRHLQPLLDERILLEKRQGKFIFYKLYIDNPLLPIYLSICEKERTITFLKNPIFKRLYETVSPFFTSASILVFGSATSQKRFQDIDVLVISENKKINKAIKNFEYTYGKKMHTIITNEKHLTKTFTNEIIKKHVIFNDHDYFVRLFYGDC